MKKIHLTTFFALLFAAQVFGQMKPHRIPSANTNPIKAENLAPVAPVQPDVPAAQNPFAQQNFWPINSLNRPVGGKMPFKAKYSAENGTPYLIEGELAANPSKALEQQAMEYLQAVKPILKLESPTEEFRIARTENDELGFRHIRLQQQWQGIPVYGAEAVLHEKDGKFYLFNGRFQPSPKLEDVVPTVGQAQAEALALSHIGTLETVKPLSIEDLKMVATEQQSTGKLVIYFINQNEPKLAWLVTVVPNITARYSCFVDAKTGDILEHHSEICKIAGHFHEVRQVDGGQLAVEHTDGENHPSNAFLPPLNGPATANANDLFGQSRSINTYQVGSTYFLIDASQTMFNSAQSDFPNDPVGVIWTIDAENTSPENNDFGAVHITSGNNSWNNPKAVSAHYHAEKAYDYFKNTFNRNSINGSGGNIVSLINVVESDDSQMDNAFWNGEAMFYGNGNQAFNAPLQKALDVAGHEMSHGVVQATANLEYLNESGALNESFADIFGAMIDRDDWKMGEDVTSIQFFPTGALRDLSDPHNGGNSVNDNGWQPAHYSERYTGSDDNGGVHINSGIVNKAFVLFANSSNVGKNKAEQVYYRALNQYLTKSSNFVDCRLAVIQAATDLHGANSTEVNAAKAAFDAVGIGSSGGTTDPSDLDTNPGEDFILMTDTDFEQLYVFAADGQDVFNPLTTVSPLSRPSVTDNGSVLVYIDQNNKMRAITFNWSAGTSNNQVIHPDAIWTNVAISKDGKRLAALTTDNDDKIWIYDFDLAAWQDFRLYNPTTAQGGQNSYNVTYADVLEWDYTGQWVMYDALSNINTTSGNIEYWDIGFIYVWDGSNFSNGHVEKLFSSLPENTSVGNPTFSKNSDYIIAFDYFDEFNEEYYLLGANIETGDVGEIYQGTDLHWPSYSIDDSQIVFNDVDGTDEVLSILSLNDDKITAAGDYFVYVTGGRQGVWFANGNRALDANDLIAEQHIRLYPNPVGSTLNLDFTTKKAGDVQLQVFDLMGRLVHGEKISAIPGENRHRISTANLTTGQYIVKLSMAEGQVAMKLLKG